MGEAAWTVTAGERVKHEEQFRTLGPVGAYITGDKAKGFFLQSRLLPQVLGLIWALSDVDGDGKMDLHEFSIACKLINLKLRGFNLPSTLPPVLKQSACPKATPTGTPQQPPGAVPLPGMVQPGVAQPGLVQPMTGMVGAPVQPPMAPITRPTTAAAPPLLPMAQSSVPLAQPSVPLQPSAPLQTAPPVMPSTVPLVQPPATMQPQPVQVVQPVLATGAPLPAQVPVLPPAAAAVPTSIPTAVPAAVPATLPSALPTAIPTAVPDGVPAAPGTAGGGVQRTGSQESGGSQTPGDWAVPQGSKLKYTQVFNMSDRTKSGYLSGVQARNILIQSHLPQQALAQIWALSDVDNDGRLSCEEFVLAMYLCESAKAGNKLPTVLPPDLIPPTNRRQRTSSIHSAGSAGTPVADTLADNSFEDKRRENFEKGQAELERRRKALLDAQRRETEERLRREREEEAKREKARLEAERRRQEELEREMQRQREMELQKEEERKRQEDFKEQARKDAEKQRQQEWEKQRLQELMNVRQRQQENLLSLKAKNQSLSIELTTKEDRVKELTQKISDTRLGVTEVKATIDTMRSTRDTHMADMNQLKAAARDQNQRLLALNQEKARLKARNTAAAGASGAEQAAVDALLSSKQMVIKQLQEKMEELQKELTSKEEDVNNNVGDLSMIKEDICSTAERCAQIFAEFSTKRKQVIGLREKLVNPDAAWGDAASSTWAGKGFGEGGADAWSSAWPPSQPHTAWPSSGGGGSGPPSSSAAEGQQQQQEHQAPARPPPPSTTFPIAKVKPAVPPAPRPAQGQPSSVLANSVAGWGPHHTTTPSSSTTTTTTTAPWAVLSTTTTTPTSTTTTTTTTTTHSEESQHQAREEGEAGLYRRRALYQFDSRNHDELSFMPGDIIVITQTEGVEPGWLGGELHGQTGWFPEAYTELLTEAEIQPDAQPAQETVVRSHLENIPEEGVGTSGPRALGEAVAVFQWRAKQRNHLSFNKGDRITVREQQDQWWYGELNNVGGWFPHSFVRMVSAATPTSPVTTPQETPEEPPMPDNLLHDDVSEFYQSLYPYQSAETGDLNFEAGEVILVVKKDGDWWHGVVNQTCGIFPSNYVELLPNQLLGSEGPVEQQEPTQEQPQPAATDTAEVQPVETEGSKGKKPEVATVLAPYDATSSNQISLQRGQLIMIRKKTASGWWEGEVQARGKKRQIGWFPATYVKVLGGSSRSTPVSMELTNREDAPPDVQSPPTATPMTQVTISPPTDEPMEGPNDASNGFAEQVEALYPYTAMNEDELTFEAGAIISVIDKEDAAWWRGTVDGAIGVFPSNYVQPFTGTSTVTPTVVDSPEADDSLCWGGTTSPDHRKARTSWNFSPGSVTEQQRQKVVQEVISTEANYLQELRLVEEVFIKRMRSSGVVSEKELDTLFVNWHELILVNSSFNNALKVRCLNSDGGGIIMFADVLCQQINQLEPYLRFCSLQIRGAALLGEKCEAGGQWVELIKQCQEHPAIQGLTLTSFMLKPMQRITKYPLLLTQLLKYTPEGHPDRYNTEEALAAAHTLCSQVNEAVSQRENTDKLEWMQRYVTCEGLQERLVFNSRTNSVGPRKLLHTGVLHKVKSKRELVGFLLSDFLLLTTPQRSVASCSSLASLERSLQSTPCTMYRKPLFLTELRVEGDRDSEVNMLLVGSGVEVALAASTPNERNNWLKKIAIAQKHIVDTERSLLQRQQSIRGRRPQGLLHAHILNGAKLDTWGKGTLQSFCEVSLGSQVHRTATATSPHPKWDSTMQFLVKSLCEDVLCITVYEKGYFKPNEFLGRTEIKIHQVYEESQHQPGTQPQLHKLKLQTVKSGEVILKISLQLFGR